MELFNTISGICSILGLLISCITLNKVTKVYNKSIDNSKTTTKNNSIGDNSQFAGRDINGNNKK